MGKAVWATPAYLAVAWTLMVSYQLFTRTAVVTVAAYLQRFVPTLSTWLSTRIEMVVFIDAFAWVFVLSSVIPSYILGKERSTLVQFLVCLTLTLSSFVLLDILESLGWSISGWIQHSVNFFTNPVFAMLYLALPYIVMVTLDYRSRKRKKQSRKIEAMTQAYLNGQVDGQT